MVQFLCKLACLIDTKPVFDYDYTERYKNAPPSVHEKSYYFQIADDVSLENLATMASGYSGSDLKELCRLAALQCLRRQISDNELDERDRYAIFDIIG